MWVNAKEKKDEMRWWLEIEPLNMILRRRRLGWHENVERKDAEC